MDCQYITMRINFNELFTVAGNMVSPKVTVHINGVTMSPGVLFSSSVLFGGVDLTKFIGRDFEIEVQNGVRVIKGVYN